MLKLPRLYRDDSHEDAAAILCILHLDCAFGLTSPAGQLGADVHVGDVQLDHAVVLAGRGHAVQLGHEGA